MHNQYNKTVSQNDVELCNLIKLNFKFIHKFAAFYIYNADIQSDIYVIMFHTCDLLYLKHHSSSIFFKIHKLSHNYSTITIIRTHITSLK